MSKFLLFSSKLLLHLDKDLDKVLFKIPHVTRFCFEIQLVVWFCVYAVRNLSKLLLFSSKLLLRLDKGLDKVLFEIPHVTRFCSRSNWWSDFGFTR